MHIYASFWHSKNQGCLCPINGLHPSGGQKEGLGACFGPDPAHGPCFDPRSFDSTLGDLSKCVAHKKLALVALTHISRSSLHVA